MFEAIMWMLLIVDIVLAAFLILWFSLKHDEFGKKEIVEFGSMLISILLLLGFCGMLYITYYPDHIRESDIYEEYHEEVIIESVVKKGYSTYTQVSIWTSSDVTPNPIIMRSDKYPVAEHMYVNSTIEWLWYRYKYLETDWGKNNHLRHDIELIIIGRWRLVDFNYTPVYTETVMEGDQIINVDNSPVDPLWIVMVLPIVYVYKRKRR